MEDLHRRSIGVDNDTSADYDSDNLSRTATSKFKVLEIQPTSIRQNRLYYKIYCIGLNTLFGSVAPLLSLIYLNICTVLGLSLIHI